MNRNPSPKPAGNLAELVDALAGSWVTVAQVPPPDSAEPITIYFQPLVADTRGRGSPRQAALSEPMALLTRGANKLALWPVRGLGSPHELAPAWASLIQEFFVYFDPNGTAQSAWNYANYHCGTMANLSEPTFWMKGRP